MKKEKIVKKYKSCSLFLAVCLLAFSMSGCGVEPETGEVKDTYVEDGSSRNGTSQDGASRDGASLSKADMFTDRDLSGEYKEAESVKISLSGNSARCDGAGVEISGSTITITAEGTYLLSGTLQDGMIVVAADDAAKVQLVLAGVEISNSTNAAIYIKSCDKVFLTLAEGADNKLVNGGSYTVLGDDNIDAVIFSKSDLGINGSGNLEVSAESAGHGIVSKDDLKIVGGNIVVKAAGHGISGKDSVRMAAGNITVTAGKDGIHSENADDTEKGYVYIADGTLNITAEGDGISAGGFVQIDSGSFAIATAGGSGNRTVAKDENGEAVSAKGIKASGNLIINDGTFDINSQDDAIHSNTDITVNGGTYQLATGDDGFHADAVTTIAGGTVTISECYEGIEGNDIVISDGYIKMRCSDDGINAAGGSDQSGFGGFMGQDRFGGGMGGGMGATDSSVTISGGTIYMYADGDGLDSNGDLIVTGGEIYVAGSENGGNAALDYTTTGQVSGGIVVAVGSAQMSMNFDSSSTQGAILGSISTQKAGTEIMLKDAEGNVLITYTAESAFSSILLSCPELKVGETYSVVVGGSSTELTLETLIYGSGSGMGGGMGPGGMPGGMGGHGGGGMRPR